LCILPDFARWEDEENVSGGEKRPGACADDCRRGNKRQSRANRQSRRRGNNPFPVGGTHQGDKGNASPTARPSAGLRGSGQLVIVGAGGGEGKKRRATLPPRRPASRANRSAPPRPATTA